MATVGIVMGSDSDMAVMKKAARQPYCAKHQAVSGGARTPPRLAPPMAMPTASARSFGGNHSLTALAAPGKQAPSPNPSPNRASPS